MFTGSTLLVKIAPNRFGGRVYDKFRFDGKVSHSNDTILIRVAPDITMQSGDEFTVFTGNGRHAGKYVLKTENDNQSVVWDDSELLSKGVIKVVSVTGISEAINDEMATDVYTTDGILVRSGVKKSKALDGLAPGVYVVNGQKTVKRN